MEALRKEYQSLCQKFEELKTLARINLDLLFLTINKVESPQAWVELDKVNDLVQAVLAGWEISGSESIMVESSTVLLLDHKPSLMDIKSIDISTSLQSDHKPSLMDIDRYLDEMALSFTQQEVMDAFNRFLGRSSLIDVTSTYHPPAGSDDDRIEMQLQWQRKVNTLESSQTVPDAARFPTQMSKRCNSSIDDASRPSPKRRKGNISANNKISEAELIPAQKSVSRHKAATKRYDGLQLEMEVDGGQIRPQRTRRKCVGKKKPVIIDSGDGAGTVKAEIVGESCTGRDTDQNYGQMNTSCLVSMSEDLAGSVDVIIMSSDEEENGRLAEGGCVDVHQELKMIMGLETLLDGNDVAAVRKTGDEERKRQVQVVANVSDDEYFYVGSVDDTLPAVVTDAMKTRGQTTDDSKGTQTEYWGSDGTESATLGSPPCLNDLESCPEDNDNPPSSDKPGVSRVKKKERKTSKSRKAAALVETETKTKRIKTKSLLLLEEFDIPSSLLDTDSLKICPICCREYKNKSSFLNHLKCHKREKDREKDPSKESKEEPLLCTICGKTLKNKSSLLHHIKAHKVIDKGEYFKCDICDKEYLGKKSLQFHMRNVHTLKRSFICDVCGKGYKNQGALREHQKCVHAEVKPELCQVCNKRFSNKNNLLRHMRIHNGTFPYSCSICGKRFRSSDNKNTHEKRHTGDFPFQCTLCNHRGFTSPGQFAIHQKKFHSQEEGGEEGGKAAVDGKKRRTTRWHRRTRLKLSIYDMPLEPLKCETCGKEFNNRANLYRHNFIHTGIKPHKCQTCGRLFTTKDAMKLHMWTHSDVKLFTCEVCHKGFNDKRNYLSHMRRIHPEHIVQTPSAKQVVPNVKKVEQPNSRDIDETTDEAHQQFPVSVPADGSGDDKDTTIIFLDYGSEAAA